MAKYLLFDKKLVNSEGLIDLRRGDDWKLNGTVIDKYARYSAPVDLSGLNGATGFWPAASGGVVAEPFAVIDPVGGQFVMSVPKADTPNLALEDAITIYATIDHPTLGLLTIETEFATVSIKDRGFDNG